MTTLLFAANQHSPKGGIDDLIGSYQSLSEDQILDIVLREIETPSRPVELDLEGGDGNRLEIQAVALAANGLGNARFWELRFATTLDADELQFASHKRELPSQACACGLVPLTRELSKLGRTWKGQTSILEYCTLDPEKSEL